MVYIRELESLEHVCACFSFLQCEHSVPDKHKNMIVRQCYYIKTFNSGHNCSYLHVKNLAYRSSTLQAIFTHLLPELAEAGLPHRRSEPEVRSPCKQLERSHQAVLQRRVLGRVSIADLVPKDERIVEDRDIWFLQKITTVRAEKLLIKCFG